jgi:hypothetical protein
VFCFQIEDGVLASFSASLGVTSYRQLQEQVEVAKAKREEALGAINAKCAQLVQQVRGYGCFFVIDNLMLL